MAIPLKSLAGDTQKPQEVLKIIITQEYVLACVATRSYMIQGARKFNTQRASHRITSTSQTTYPTLAPLTSVSNVRPDPTCPTLKQLEVFLVVTQHEGKCIEDIWGVAPADHEYRQLMGIIRKLMDAGYRYDGLGLLEWGKTNMPGSKVKVLKLTKNGSKLRSLMQ